ncbi:MAG: branched-chain amino acid ABC transporter permease [Gammaproteobacteria bacterium]|nr:branched-chain amino acid ABC transporter permease [Gammaproteobacteria bacterium]
MHLHNGSQNRSIWYFGFFGVAIGLALAPIWFGTYNLTLFVIHAILALSLGLLWGMGGILSFGHSAFYGLGAYLYAVGSINFAGWPLGSVSALVLALLVVAVFAYMLGAMMFYGRISDVYLGVITLVVTLLLYTFLNAAAGSEYIIGKARLGGFNGIPGFSPLNLTDTELGLMSGDKLYVLATLLLLLLWWFCAFLARTHWGRVLRSIQDNELRSTLLGYDVRQYKTQIFTLSASMAALSGVLFASWAEIVTPGLFSLGQAAETIIWVIVGGLKTWFGPIIGAFILGALKTALAKQDVIHNSLLIGFILLLFVLLVPQGIVPTWQKYWQKWSHFKNQRRAQRYPSRIHRQDHAK